MSIEDITHQHDMTGNERRRLSVPLLFRPTVRCGSPPESALYLNTLTVSFLRMDAATGSLRDARRDGRRSSCVREMSRRAGCTCVNSIRDAGTAPPAGHAIPRSGPPNRRGIRRALPASIARVRPVRPIRRYLGMVRSEGGRIC
jgi:hypothetical protein